MRTRIAGNLTAALFLLAATGALAGTERTTLIPRIGVFTPTGWDEAIVPQLVDTAVPESALHVPPTLTHAQAVWFNWAESRNPAVMGYWTDQVMLDSTVIRTVDRYDGDWASGTWYDMNVGPLYLWPGRHTVTARVDIYDQVGEDYTWRYDNWVDEQFISAPVAMTFGPDNGMSVRPPPPHTTRYGDGPPNGHAFALPRSGSYAWMLALGTSAGDDYDLSLYDDYTDSRTGLTNLRGSSASVGDSAELIVGAGDVLPGTLYPFVIRRALGPGWGYALDWEDVRDRVSGSEANWSSEALAWNQLGRIYQVHLTGGIQVPMSVWPLTGTSHMELRVFSVPAGGIQVKGQALARSHPVPSQDYEVLSFIPPSDGDYLVVAWRPRTTGSTVTYRMAVGSNAVSVAERSQAAAPLAVWPSPARDRARISFALPAAGRAEVEVLDVTGRRVAALSSGVLPAGPQQAEWDLRDAAGRAVPAGVYWVRVRSAEHSEVRRLAVVR